MLIHAFQRYAYIGADQVHDHSNVWLHLDTACTDWRQCVVAVNPFTTNDASMHHDPCELSISLWEFVWSIKY